MNELAIEKTMTVKEVADIFKVTEQTIRNYVRKLYPELLENGKSTYLDESHITEIKKELTKNYSIDLKNGFEVTTDLEMEQKAFDVMVWYQKKLETANNRINRLIHDTKTYTSTEIAKELNLRSASELNETLKDKGIQYKVNKVWVLTAKYSDMGYESIKQEERDNGLIIYNRHWTGKGRDFIINTIMTEKQVTA